MKTPPKGSVFETKKFKKYEFFESALQRLNDEVGNYFDLVEKFNFKSERKIGFWSSIRILMPIIESVASGADLKPQELLAQLNVKTPNLVWDLFRHSLIHGDYIQHAKYGEKNISWGISLAGTNHIIQNGHIGIDPIFLFKSLKEYLETEIRKRDATEVEVEVGVIYQNPKQEIVNDFSQL